LLLASTNFIIPFTEGGDYLSITFLDMASGHTFNIITKNIEYLKLKQMTKYKADFNFIVVNMV
jgi:hypothetical protein